MKKEQLPGAISIIIALIIIAVGYMNLPPEPGVAPEVRYNDSWKIGSNEIEINQLFSMPCVLCDGYNLEPQINFSYEGKNYTTIADNTNCKESIYLKPVYVTMDNLIKNFSESTMTFQKQFMAKRPLSIYPNGVIAAMYAKTEGENVYFSVEEIYDPGWGYDPDLVSQDLRGGKVVNYISDFSIMIYSLLVILVAVILSILGYAIVKSAIKNR